MLLAYAINNLTSLLSFYAVANAKSNYASLFDKTLRNIFLIFFVVYITNINAFNGLNILGLLEILSAVLSLISAIYLVSFFINKVNIKPSPLRNKISSVHYGVKVLNFLLRNSNLILGILVVSNYEIGLYAILIKLSFVINVLYQISVNWNMPLLVNISNDNFAIRRVRLTGRILATFSLIGLLLMNIYMGEIAEIWNFAYNDFLVPLNVLMLAQIVNVVVGPVEQGLMLNSDISWNLKLGISLLVVQSILIIVFGHSFDLIGIIVAESVILILGNLLRSWRLGKSMVLD